MTNDEAPNGSGLNYRITGVSPNAVNLRLFVSPRRSARCAAWRKAWPPEKMVLLQRTTLQEAKDGNFLFRTDSRQGPP